MTAITAEPSRPDSLAEALEPEHGTKAHALAVAYERFTYHHNRSRFEAEVQAVHGCTLVAFIEHREALS